MISKIYFPFFVVLFLWCDTFFVTCQIADDEDPYVLVKEGILKGLKEKTLTGTEFFTYKSIPYALPPLGKLRFKDPVPMTKWNGILEATKDPNFCKQSMNVKNISESGRSINFYDKEDCLYLNVHTPKLSTITSKYPVIIFIHGGLFIMGGSQKYPPYILMDEEIVFVNIQYRLGIFGFLSTEDNLMPGNMGLMDQQLALKWVKKNIGSFGGDPNRITILGDSAGGSSVHFHILSPGSNGLFHRAIMMSGTALGPFAMYFDHKKYAAEAGKLFGCSLDKGTPDYLECMQQIDADELQQYVNSKLVWSYFGLQTLPRVDGRFLPNFPEVLMKEGNFNKVDIIIGGTGNEAVYEIQVFYETPSALDKINTKFDTYGPISLLMEGEPNAENLARKSYQHYLQREDIKISLAEDQDKLLRLYTDRIFKDNLVLTIQFLMNRSDSDLYIYEFNFVGNITSYNYIEALKNVKWSAHDDDLQYLFGGGPILTRELEDITDLKMKNIMISTWTNFAKTGNPTPSGSSFVWEKATKNNFQQLILNDDPEMKFFNISNLREFWSTLDTRQNRLLNSLD